MTADPTSATIDACAFHEWPRVQTLLPYLPEGWATLTEGKGERPAPLDLKSAWRYVHPQGGYAPESYPADGSQPGSDVGLFREHLIDSGHCQRIVLGYYEGILSSALPYPYLTVHAIKAINDWNVEHWLEPYPEHYGQVLISAGMPGEAADEIRRLAGNEKMVAVAMGANALGKPFGHPVYRPIHEAAAEAGLPLVIQVGCDGMGDLVTLPTGIGLPSTYAEYDVMGAQALHSHVASLATEGVFDLFPDLQVLLVGGGAAWMPWLMWNLDGLFRMTRRMETPWMTRLPSQYIADHIRLSTYQLERPADPARLAMVLSLIPDAERTLLYSSGYPRSDSEAPASVISRLPEAWHRAVLVDNAADFFRWPDASAPTYTEESTGTIQGPHP